MEYRSEYLFYCPKCGRMVYLWDENTECDICGSAMIETPHEYNLSNTFEDELLKKGWAENKHIYYQNKQRCFDEVVSKSPEFDIALYNSIDNLLKQRSDAFHEVMNAAKNRVKCHYCGSTNVQKISLMSKAIHNSIFGIWSLGRNTKEFHCNNCGADF